MSDLTSYSQRKSWRQKSSKPKNRWLPRFILTLLATILVGVFLYIIFRGRPDRTLHTFLLHARSYDSDVIMPPLFGATAANRILTDLNGEEIEGKANSIRDVLKDTTKIKKPLADLDDTVMVIVRGYLLSDESGEISIACSDLGVSDRDRSGATGLLPLAELLAILADEGPADSESSRLVVLDIEPLASVPRLNQFGDRIFESLQKSVEGLRGTHANRVWVLATRGPLQNAGWDPRSQLPLSTQSLLDAISGGADFNQDYEVRLDEVCRYLSARYQRLAQRSNTMPPQIMLLRGEKGRVDDVESASEVWLAQAIPVEPSEEEPEEPMEPMEKPDGTNDVAVNTVVYQAESSIANDNGSDNGSDNGEASDSEVDSDKSKSEEPIAPQTPKRQSIDGPKDGPKPPDRFWDVRDRFEMARPTQKLHPIAVAPHLYRKLVQEVLHAEIESLDDNALQSRQDIALQATSNLAALEAAFVSDYPPFALNGVSNELVERLFKLWRQAVAQRDEEAVDEQVRIADSLQHAIAIGRLRLWYRLDYQQQAILGQSTLLADETELERLLDEAEELLAKQQGSQVSVVSMREKTDRIHSVVRRFDALVRTNVSEVIDEFGRADEENVWNVLRKGYAWLRSPLPSGSQRRELSEAIGRAEIETVDAGLLNIPAAKVSLADLRANSDAAQQIARIQKTNSQLTETMLLGTQPTAASLVSKLQDTSGNFAEQFAATLRIDPRDVDSEDLAKPILHRVAAIPRRRQASARILDPSLRAAGSRLQLDALESHLWVEINPDSNREAKYQISMDVNTGSDFLDGVSHMEARWEDGLTLRDEQTIELTVPRRETSKVRLNLKALRHADEQTSSVPLRISIQPVGLGLSPDESDQIPPLDVRIELPKKDRVLLAVRSPGMSREFISGEDSLPNGVWLRTFSSRKTTFEPSLVNDSGRSARARVWLLRLENPFQNQGIEAYYPELVANRMDRLRGQLLNSEGRVFDSILEGRPLLKGPVELDLGPGNKRTALSWKNAAPVDGATTPASAPAETVTEEPAGGLDVSHGMAVAVRLIDESGKTLPGGDQIVWMIPNPWSPSSYVDIDPEQVRYDRGEVQVAAKLKKEIDGDNLDDMIPEIETRPVRLAWTEDDQWDRFEPGLTRPLENQSLELKHLMPTAGQIEVPVSESRSETVLRLDVDDWPRAIRRLISHRQGALARETTRWDTIDFSEVSIDYGDRVPKNSDDDEILERFTIHHPDQTVVFRGRGKTLTTRLSADLSPLLYADDSPPEIRLSDGDRNAWRYWTDRLIETVANRLEDDGKMVLTTTVGDLTSQWSEASRADDQLDLQATLKVGDQVKNAALQIKLDSTSPVVGTLRTRTLGPYYVGKGNTVEWTIVCADPERNNTRSGIRKLVVDFDKDGDGKPDSTDKPYVFSKLDAIPQIPRRVRTFELDEPGRLRIAVQVWDEAGLASEPKSDWIDVIEKPKPKPKPQPRSNGTPSMAEKPTTAEPPPPPKKGSIRGQIESGHTMRGTLSLSPVPAKMRPSDGKIELGSSNPRFEFSNLPAGDYTLNFKGTVNNRSKTMSWSGLKTDEAGGPPTNTLTP